MRNEALGTTIEEWEKVADLMEDPKPISRRGLFTAAARAARNIVESSNKPKEEPIVTDNKPEPIAIDAERPAFPFERIETDQILARLDEEIARMADFPAIQRDLRIAQASVRNGLLNMPENFHYGNMTYYGPGLWTDTYYGQGLSARNEDSAEYLQADMLCAPNTIFFNPKLWEIYMDIYRNTLDIARLKPEDIKNKSQFPMGVFNAIVRVRYDEITAEMKSLYGKKVMHVILKPKKGYFKEGPHWQANPQDIQDIDEWEIQRVSVQMIGDSVDPEDVIAKMHEFVGETPNGNFIADCGYNYAGEVYNDFNNSRHRPLSLMVLI